MYGNNAPAFDCCTKSKTTRGEPEMKHKKDFDASVVIYGDNVRTSVDLLFHIYSTTTHNLHNFIQLLSTFRPFHVPPFIPQST